MQLAPGKPILIVGASARAAAQSAARRGRAPMAIDLFGDLDLLETASSYQKIPSSSYPEAIPELARKFPEAPFLFTGGLENHAGIIKDLELHRDNEGCAADLLPPLRDPFQLVEMYRRSGIPCPEVRRADPPRSSRSRWLKKPRRGCGGRGIAPYHAGEPVPAGWFLEEWIEGLPLAAIFSGDGRGGAQLLGATLQLVGESRLGASPFAYCGSVGPLPLTDEIWTHFRRLGECISSHFPVRGIFGVDAILRDDVPYPLEINPRYTASVEILELSRAAGGLLGKAILFAREEAEILEDLRRVASRLRLADIPAPGTAIAAGRPIVTVFSEGESIEACRRSLLEKARAIYGLLAPAAAKSWSARSRA